MNGYPKVQKTFAHVSGYVEDIMAYVPYMTVREGIEFSAAMRLSKKVKSKERKVFAEEVRVSSDRSSRCNLILKLQGPKNLEYVTIKELLGTKLM